MSSLPLAVLDRVAMRVNRDYGEDVCVAADVRVVHETGTLDDREAVASRILQELEEYGFR